MSSRSTVQFRCTGIQYSYACPAASCTELAAELMAGQVSRVIRVLERDYAPIFERPSNRFLLFRLRCQQFIERYAGRDTDAECSYADPARHHEVRMLNCTL